jgi:hypothetical protein
LTWLRRLRERSERIEFQAEALLYEFRGEAYNAARRRRDEASSQADSQEWDRVAQAIARKIRFRASTQRDQDQLRPKGEPEEAWKSQTDSTPRLVEKLNRVEVEEPCRLPLRPSAVAKPSGAATEAAIGTMHRQAVPSTAADTEAAPSDSSDTDGERRGQSPAGDEDVQPSTVANASATAPQSCSTLAPRTARKRKRRQPSRRAQAKTMAGAKESTTKASP